MGRPGRVTSGGSVLDIEAGHSRDYARDPDAAYDQSQTLYFDVSNKDGRNHEKEPVVGLALNGQARVWPLCELVRVEHWPLTDLLSGTELSIVQRESGQAVSIVEASGASLPGAPAERFAWVPFFPNTLVFSDAD